MAVYFAVLALYSLSEESLHLEGGRAGRRGREEGRVHIINVCARMCVCVCVCVCVCACVCVCLCVDTRTDIPTDQPLAVMTSS